MFDDEPSAVIKITSDGISPELRSLIYTVQALSVSLTVYLGLSSIKLVSKLIASLIYQRNMYDRI